MKLYPVMLNIEGKHVLVVGGGAVAFRKIRDVLECGARVTVVAPLIDESIVEMQSLFPDMLQLVKRKYQPGDADGKYIVFSAADDSAVNKSVHDEADEKGVLINAVDDPPNCNFFVPSWFNRDGLIVAVSTSGISPSFAAKIRRDIEKALPESIEDILHALQKARALLQKDDEYKHLAPNQRGHILKQIVGDNNLLEELTKSYHNDSIKTMLHKIIK